MALPTASSWRPIGCAVTAGLILAACTLAEAPAKKKRTPVDPGEDFYDDVPSAVEPMEPDVNPNPNAFGASERPAADAATNVRPDAGVTEPDGGGPVVKTYCATGPKAGDLAIVELMISSKAGSSDSGEWVEIQNTQPCWLKLKGISVASPRGAATTNSVAFTDDIELAPNETFVVADSADPLKNHGIGGKLLSWESTDVMKNDGDTIVVKLGEVEIDRVTYPAFNNLTAGRSLAFPAGCAWPQRSDWTRWSLAFTAFSPGFQGTPNADNIDVACF